MNGTTFVNGHEDKDEKYANIMIMHVCIGMTSAEFEGKKKMNEEQHI